ncbi:hypothetical protein lbkm_4239 [Lachnospiraceae bacterium KM106-2]|nr:hypothetical protein lbkm_4239 [Lachnospiraceae bacterium KM106-2]
MAKTTFQMMIMAMKQLKKGYYFLFALAIFFGIRPLLRMNQDIDLYWFVYFIGMNSYDHFRMSATKILHLTPMKKNYKRRLIIWNAIWLSGFAVVFYSAFTVAALFIFKKAWTVGRLSIFLVEVISIISCVLLKIFISYYSSQYQEGLKVIRVILFIAMFVNALRYNARSMLKVSVMIAGICLVYSFVVIYYLNDFDYDTERKMLVDVDRREKMTW